VGYLERVLAEPEADSAEDGAASQHAFFTHQMHNLGRRTAELHRSFALRTGDPAFDPERVSPAELDGWFGTVRQEATATLDALAQSLDRLPEAIRECGHRLLVQRQSVLEALQPAELAHATIVRSRYHGDYHLGQVLLVADDFVITDFEGEPARPVAERRAKHSPLRDVAGMLRSFDYAGMVALAQSTTERPADRLRLEPAVRAWEQETEAAFLEGYRAAIADAATYPADEEVRQHLLRLFLIEKCLYEIRYELNNRPAWVGIPVQGLLRLLA
jgi:maltose alpha-D-glucosyltransferase/alpha-amylase